MRHYLQCVVAVMEIGLCIAGLVFAGSIGMVPILLFIHYVLKSIGGCD